MRKTYHLCLASHDEVMHRSEEDYIYDVNCMAVAISRTESRGLADSVMSTHDHLCVQSDDVRELCYVRRNAYTRYFNAKYGRKGRLGEKDHFISEINGIRHITAAISYVNRNPLHHGVSPTPFGYRFCSANAVFQKALGKESAASFLSPCSRYRTLPSNVILPLSYRMDSSGMILHEDFLDIRYVEEIYVSPRSFLYMMNRYSDEKWIMEQQEEESTATPVTLENMEYGYSTEDIRRMKSNETGRIDLSALSDIQLCKEIDTYYVPKSSCHSVYGLSETQKQHIGNELWRKYRRRTTEKQIRRCLVL